MGIKFEVRASNIDENITSNLAAKDVPIFLAQKKSEVLRNRLKENEILITADTVVLYNNEIIYMKSIGSIDKINELTKNDFIDIFGNVFEKTYWIADKAFNLKPYKNFNELLSTIIKIYEIYKKQ